MTPRSSRIDVNAIVASFLRDLAAVQTSPEKRFAYRRAAGVVFDMEHRIDALVQPDGSLQKIAGLGPSSTRVVLEVLDSGGSPTTERAITESGKRADVERQRGLRDRFLSRAEVVRVLTDRRSRGPTLGHYRGDLQMHSTWSDGAVSIAELAEAALKRQYSHIAVTDHSYGLPIARGMTMANAALQHAEIDRVNRTHAGGFRVFKGIEANIGPDGEIDLSIDERRAFELVLAAPHSQLRRPEDQTARMLRAVTAPGVHILAHARGRVSGTRAGIVADWDRVFESAQTANVAIEIDGDPSRQDLDHALATRALAAGCLFALDSDAHNTDQLAYADTAVAHARLAGIPPARIINCWPTKQLHEWLTARP